MFKPGLKLELTILFCGVLCLNGHKIRLINNNNNTFVWLSHQQVVDVNQDGREDLLTSTWSQLGDPGALLAYEIPDNWQDASQWVE